ncbi:hypothetical protein PIB30_045403 [Stylosanthes scabra]|uniref:Uncharacterized protein n=1 Tax=Stylosanthes scabra TaxID=79078 RepID=A0ABU6XEK1_9FABA|nr:hypothetical protein [Stylosanthes scabra]
MEVLSMFQRPRSVALQYEKPGTYGTVLIYPLDRLVECGFADSIAWSFIPRENDTHFTVVLLVRFGALAEIGAYQVFGAVAGENMYDLGYDSEPERTLSRRRREARHARQAALEQQLNMAAEHQDDNMNMGNQNRITLGQYINPTTNSCGSTIRRPAIQANNFELKPSLI